MRIDATRSKPENPKRHQQNNQGKPLTQERKQLTNVEPTRAEKYQTLQKQTVSQNELHETIEPPNNPWETTDPTKNIEATSKQQQQQKENRTERKN